MTTSDFSPANFTSSTASIVGGENSGAKTPRCAAIIPAYNEAGRITNVLKSIAAAHYVDELIVVTDGCDDTTADEAHGFAAWFAQNAPQDRLPRPEIRIFELKQNIGKGGAMTHGAMLTEAEVLLFLDADLIGLQTAQVDAMLEPMCHPDPARRADMTLGLFGAARGGVMGWWLSFCHRKIALRAPCLDIARRRSNVARRDASDQGRKNRRFSRRALSSGDV
jgi:glycosyltransferase involved in cell wall biosynthesis